MKYLLFVFLMAISTFSQCTTQGCCDSLITEIFTMNGLIRPATQDSNFSYSVFVDYNGVGTLAGSLTIKYKGLDTVPERLFDQTGLTGLNLVGNNIRILNGTGIRKLYQLRTLRIDSNAITDIPGIYMLTSLTYLGVSHNQILGLNGAWGANPAFKPQVAFSVNKIGCNPDWVSQSSINWVTAHDVNPNWYSTQYCGTSDAVKVLPKSFKISYSPNPFTSNTTISYTIAEPSNISIKVYDIKGTLVKSLVSAKQGVGDYAVSFGGVKSGAYISRVVVGNKVFTKKLLLVK